ncbi:OprO/OprP family phosphate-selective porin [Bacteroidales bacterium OttesenSCG-928-M11]|nr:OprO/OprP family phosphate-selective porin [Bacteroidales bacterium OttesenSCG-928-M11]
MNKVFLLIGLLFFSISLSAQYRESDDILKKLLWDGKMLNVLIDMRVDGQTQFKNKDLDYVGFKGQTMRLWFAGEIVPGFTYRVRYRLNKPQDPLIRDNYSSAIDHAWLAFAIQDEWKITVGRQSMQIGTFECDYNGADLYLSSMVNGDIDLYKTGVTAAFNTGEQTFSMQIVNSDYSQFASEEYKNKSLNMNLLWQGSLFDGLLKTRCAYSLFQYEESTFYHWLTTGLQMNINNFSTELDYFSGRRMMDYGGIVGNPELGLRQVDDQSLSLNLKYYLGKWHFLGKGVWNKRKDTSFDDTAYSGWGTQAAVEFYPFNRERLRYLRFHAAYVYQRTIFDGPFYQQPDADSHLALLGVRWLFKAK